MIKSLKCLQIKKPEDPILSVLVRIKNEGKALPEFWRRMQDQSIFEQTEVIFLDSGSTDESLSILQSLPVSIYTINPDDFNFGSSCNLLVSLSNAPVVAFLSGHVLLEQINALEVLHKTLAPHRYAAAFFRQVPNKLWGSTKYEEAFLAKMYKPTSSQPIAVKTPVGFSNAASGLTRYAWERLPMPEMNGWEDHAWAQQHLSAGGKLFYLPNTKVMHSHAETSDDVYRRVLLNVRARKLRPSIWRFCFYFVGVSVSMLLRGAKFPEACRYGFAHASAYFAK